MDIVSFSQGKKAQKEVLKLQKDVGNTATTKHGSEDVKGTFESVDKRLEDIEFKLSPGETNKMISDATKKTMINLMKQQFKVDAIMQSRKESFENMVFDSFLDESSINKTKSSNYKYDSSLGRYTKNILEQKMTLEFNKQITNKAIKNICVSLNISTLSFDSIKVLNSKISDIKDSKGYYNNLIYEKESEIINIGQEVIFKEYNLSSIIPEKTSVKIMIKTSNNSEDIINKDYIDVKDLKNKSLKNFIQVKYILISEKINMDFPYISFTTNNTDFLSNVFRLKEI